jgi:polyhydroxyalkanoate synthesis regulator phasin
MPFGLQSDIPDRALPDALHSLLVQQTETLEALLHYAQGTMDTLRAKGDMSPQEQTTWVDGLAKEVSERLIALEDQHRQRQTHLEEFQRLLRQQGNSILAYTVERVKNVLVVNFMATRQQLDAIIHGQSPE